MTMVRLRLRRISSTTAVLLAAITATTLLLFIATTEKSASRPVAIHRASTAATKTTVSTIGVPASSSLLRRSNCQIIYVLGVEGSLHHGFMPVIKSLAEQQVDPATGSRYHVLNEHNILRAAIFGSKKFGHVPISDPQLVQETLATICPPNNRNGSEEEVKYIILEGNSFPSGGVDSTFRVPRQQDWQSMTPNEIATSPQALHHPTNLYEFYNAYSPHVDIRFVVLHRPYLDTIASHARFDSGPIQHSTVISGFLLLLSRFLVSHMYYHYNNASDSATSGDGKDVVPLWTIVCAEQLSSKEHKTTQQLLTAREQIVRSLANFLGWPQQSCLKCFDNWKESSKESPEKRLGTATTNIVLDHAKALVGIWPPRRSEDGLPQQQCRM
jgi:hypothetical protein